MYRQVRIRVTTLVTLEPSLACIVLCASMRPGCRIINVQVRPAA